VRLTSIPVALTVLFVAGLPAAAKGEDGFARIVTPIYEDAEPGTTLKVSWRAFVRVDGAEVPFNAEGVFIRLTGFGGATSEALAAQPTEGLYLARVVVPAGGIRQVEVGVAGTASYPDGTSERSEALFLLEGQVMTTDAAIAAPAVSPGESGATTGVPARPGTTDDATGATVGESVTVLTVIAVMVALLLLVVVGGLRRLQWIRPGRASTRERNA
jgi:hypothetical protein